MAKELIETPRTLLTDLTQGEEGRVIGIHGQSLISRRMMEMGVIPGVNVRVIKSAPFGDPIEVRVRGYSLAMRRSEAANIEISR